MHRRQFPIFRWLAIVLIMITVLLATIQLISYSRIRNNFPMGLQVGQVPIGGLTYTQAAERIYTVYRSPIEVTYGGNRIHVRPAVLGFEPQVDKMLAVADNQRVTEPFWSGFWNFLWDRNIEIINIPLNVSYDEDRIREFLSNEVAVRYDTPATPPKPIPGTTQFESGEPGTQLELNRATLLVIDALSSPTNRSITLPLDQAAITRPSLNDLEIMLRPEYQPQSPFRLSDR